MWVEKCPDSHLLGAGRGRGAFTEPRLFRAHLYSARVCNLRVTDWRSEPGIDCSEDVIEAGVMGSRAGTLSPWRVQQSYTGYNQGT